MKPSTLRTLLPLLAVLLLLTACTGAGADQPTATPEATATPVPPTPTPSPEEILEEGWQAYEDGDYKTAEEIAKDVRTLAEESGTENGEAWGLLGLIELETGTTGTAIYYLEKAQELGFQSDALDEAKVATYIEKIDELITDIFESFDADSILADIHQAQEYLTSLQALDPENPETVEFVQFMQPEAFNPADYTEAELPLNEIENMLELLDNASFFNPESSHFQELYEKYPSNPIVLYAYGVQRLWQGESQHAVDLLSSSVEIEPANATAWLYLGFAYYDLGWLRHAHEVYTHCLILDPENETAYENIADISWLQAWTDYSFQHMGFSLLHSIEDTFIEVIDSTPAAGKMKMEDDFMFLQITWETDGETLTQDQLQTKMVNAMDANAPGFKSAFKPVAFGGIPMIFRDYSYRVGSSSVYADAVVVGCSCGDKSYVFDFRFPEDGNEHELMHWVMAIYLESFSCGTE